jgi:cytochrome c-type biogenesis protein CcmH
MMPRSRSRICSKLTPLIVERYPGTSGNTQGEIKETSPAAKTSGSETPAISMVEALSRAARWRAYYSRVGMGTRRLATVGAARKAAVLAIAVTAALILPTMALSSERHPSLGELEGEVMCPTCHVTLEQSDAPAARRIERFIRLRIAAGDTKSEIKDKLVAQFGPAILAAPPKRGFDLLAWWLPIAGVLVAGAIVGVGAWRWSRASRDAPGPGSRVVEPIDPELERRLDLELSRFE